MDSAPPATMMLALPVMIVCAPRMMAFTEEAQTLLMVVQTVESGRPAPRAHCRAGFWPMLGYVIGVALCVLRKDILCREHIAKEDFLNIFRLDACSFDSSFRMRLAIKYLIPCTI